MSRLWIVGALILGCILVVKASIPSSQCDPKDFCSAEVLFECTNQYRSARACEILNNFCEEVKGADGTISPVNVEQITEEEIRPTFDDFISVFPLNPHDTCGLSNSNGLDSSMLPYEGQALPGEFPWAIALISNDEYIGGGSLVAPGAVLTAAHLLRGKSEVDIVVRAGEWDLSNARELFLHEERLVKKIVRHQAFLNSTGANNLALLFLETPFKVQEHIRTICLPKEIKSLEGKRCKVAGWGRRLFPETHHSHILKKMELPMVEKDTCQRQLRNTRLGLSFILDPSLICAGGELNNDACLGDGGSALFCALEEDPKRYEQVGIVNWGIECGKQDVPATYTNVAMFRDWIDQQLAENMAFDYRSSATSTTTQGTTIY